MSLHKIVHVVALFGLNCVLFPAALWAETQVPANSPQTANYYTQRFIDDVRHGLKDQELKKSILTTFKNHVSIGYEHAKVFLMGNFYLVQDHNSYAVKDVYCDRMIDANEFPAGQAPAPNRVPANEVINTEHTWPQSRFNENLDKGIQKADLHHLFPTDSKINNIRGNFKFGEVQKDLSILKCHGPRFGTAGDSSEQVFEPPQVHKGNVARALFYFSVKYKLSIDPKEEATLRKWMTEDPVDQEEMARNDEIEKAQHSRNPFIDFPELANNISDF